MNTHSFIAPVTVAGSIALPAPGPR